ncbi:MAG: asparaginase domain-containing protein, partial [Azoarcus sp.]|nr:asparaginase domain-containing protein [Azoarcus sp.]
MSYFDRFRKMVTGLFPAQASKKSGGDAPVEGVVSGLPNIHVLATGGTIAGRQLGVGTRYQAGELSVEALLGAVPAVRSMANVSSEQVANIGSQDMDEDIWLKLARRINE